jgi:hypothetical protein
MRAVTYLTRILSRGTFSTTGISSHRSFLRASSARFHSTSINTAAPSYYRFGVKEDIARAKSLGTLEVKHWGLSLETLELKHWGFVVYRCTYGSQEKWDKFIALAKQEAYNWLKSCGTEDLALYDKMELTVIEDAETLDGASILDTTRKFQAYVEEERTEETQGYECTPRYHHFVHVDEESLESVVDDEKAREWIGYFCKVVFPSSVMIRETARLAGEIEADQDPLDEQVELLDCVKKIPLGSLVPLYVDLLAKPDSWYDIYVEIDYDNIRAGLATV